MTNAKKYLAEFIGTATLVFIGCGTAVATGVAGANANAAYILTALAFGLGLITMAYSIGNISGCHINPAVSLGLLLDGRLSVKEFCGYVCSQFAGGLFGAFLIGCVNGFKAAGNYGSNGLFGSGGEGIIRSLFIEIVLTFIFVLLVLGVTSKLQDAPKVAGLIIGLGLIAVHIIGIHYTGTSVNPARSFGPAIFSIINQGAACIKVVWIFIVGPAIGGALAGLCWKFLAEAKEKPAIVHHKKH